MNFAIVGCGHIAKKHGEAIRDIQGAKLYAVCDKIAANMELYIQQFGAISYESYDAMLADPQVDIVNICTPSGTHAPLAIKAAEAKKHIVLEKPMALTLEDAQSIIRACEEHNVKLTVVHPNRFRPAIIELRKLFDRGLFGRLSHADATVRWNRNQEYYNQAPWRGSKKMDGGVLMNQAIHNLDLLMWMMGPIEEIQAFTATRIRNIESEDVATAVVKFQNGALGVVEAATTIYPKNLEESLSIFGEFGAAQIGGANANWVKHLVFDGMSAEETSEIAKKIEEDPYGKPGHQAILEDMMEAINTNRAPAVTGEDGLKAVKFVLGILQASEQKKSLLWQDIN